MQARNGETLEVSLEEPAATGYHWRLVQAPPQVQIVDERYEAPGGPIGGAGRGVTTLRATEPGR